MTRDELRMTLYVDLQGAEWSVSTADGKVLAKGRSANKQAALREAALKGVGWLADQCLEGRVVLRNSKQHGMAT